MNVDRISATYNSLKKRYPLTLPLSQKLSQLKEYAQEAMPQQEANFEQIFTFFEKDLALNTNDTFSLTHLLCLVWEACHDETIQTLSQASAANTHLLLENLLSAHGQAKTFGNGFNTYVNKILVTLEAVHPNSFSADRVEHRQETLAPNADPLTLLWDCWQQMRNLWAGRSHNTGHSTEPAVKPTASSRPKQN